jgi:hypothetical protein
VISIQLFNGQDARNKKMVGIRCNEWEVTAAILPNGLLADKQLCEVNINSFTYSIAAAA